MDVTFSESTFLSITYEKNFKTKLIENMSFFFFFSVPFRLTTKPLITPFHVSSKCQHYATFCENTI